MVCVLVSQGHHLKMVLETGHCRLVRLSHSRVQPAHRGYCKLGSQSSRAARAESCSWRRRAVPLDSSLMLGSPAWPDTCDGASLHTALHGHLTGSTGAVLDD